MLSTCFVYSHCLKIKLGNMKKKNKKSKFKQSSSKIVTFGHLYVIVDGLLFSLAIAITLGVIGQYSFFRFLSILDSLETLSVRELYSSLIQTLANLKKAG